MPSTTQGRADASQIQYYIVPSVIMSKATKSSKKSEGEVPSACAITCLTSIEGLLEKHRASIASDLKNSFAALESRLDKMQTTVSDHGQHIISLETSAESDDQRIHTLKVKLVALADSNNKLLAKTMDLESRIRRNNSRIIGLPESIEGPTPTMFFSKLLDEVLGEEYAKILDGDGGTIQPLAQACTTLPGSLEE